VALLAGCARGADPQAPVARVDGRVITSAELEAETKGALASLEAKHQQEVHDTKARALDALVDKRLLEVAASKRGVSVDALLKQAVTDTLSAPSEEAVRKVYDDTRATGRPLPPLPDVRASIEAFLRGQDAERGREAFLARLRSEAKVESLLPPYIPAKVALKADGPVRGRADAPVTVVVFSDYQCPFCRQADPALRQLLNAYATDVRVVYQEFPLSIHSDAEKASEAALCAGEQGRYPEMHDALFARPDAMHVDDLKRAAAALGLDASSFASCLDSGRKAPVVDASRRLGESLGVEGTPAFFVNGHPLMGAQTFTRLKEVVDYELASAKR
jgi:protein-disulfide isomerase